MVERARIVLGSAAGDSGSTICGDVGVSRPTVTLWLDRYEAGGLAALRARSPALGTPETYYPGRGRSHRAPHDTNAAACGPRHALEYAADGRGDRFHHSTIARIWKAHGLRPHRVRPFKLSTDPAFVEKLRDVVGLYLQPPERAIIFSLDEKSQIQALDRTQPGLPLKRGRAGTFTHDYKRHGTTTLLRPLDVATGHIIQECMPKHRHQEFLRFMNTVVRTTAKDLDIHVILDNYATHKHPKVKQWLHRHRRVHFHFTPTSASWLNLVERFFSELTERQLRRLAVTSVDELIQAITDYITCRNENPKPFTWTATVRQILKKVHKANETLATLH